MRRPRYFAKKVDGKWVTTDGISQFYEYVGPSKAQALHIANHVNGLLAQTATILEDQDYYWGIGQYAKRHHLDE